MSRVSGAVWWRIGGIVVALVVCVWLLLAVDVPDLDTLRAEVTALGPWAGPLFAGLYALITPTPLPKPVLTLAAGSLFGIGYGLAVVLTGATAGAVLAFYLSRLLGRQLVLRYAWSAITRIDGQVLRYGIWAVLMLRLIPIVPFTVLNWAAGVTAVRLRDFVLATPIGMVPATTAGLTVGAYGNRPFSWPFLVAIVGLVAIAAGGLLVSRRRA